MAAMSEPVAAIANEIAGPWCLIVTRQGREMRVEAELALAGWSTYLPMQTDWAGNGANRAPRNAPLFSRYLFGYCNAGGDLAAPTGIEDLVTVHRRDGDRPAVAITLLARLMWLEAAHGLDLTYEKRRQLKRGFVCGQPVTVRAGSLAGMEVIIARVLSEREIVVRLPQAICGVDEAVIRSGDVEAACVPARIDLSTVAQDAS